jgi:hypothetical protein
VYYEYVVAIISDMASMAARHKTYVSFQSSEVNSVALPAAFLLLQFNNLARPTSHPCPPLA